jgi:hypothetical protein
MADENYEFTSVSSESVHPYNTTFPLSSFFLPYSLTLLFRSRHIDAFYAWQYECLNIPGIISGEKNLVYSVPTRFYLWEIHGCTFFLKWWKIFGCRYFDISCPILSKAKGFIGSPLC